MDNKLQHNRESINKILDLLKKNYPEVRIQLNHKNPFQLLIATILSAQCTDRQVNKVTAELFKELNTPQKIANAPIAMIEKLIHSTGFFRNKARHIKETSKILVEKFHSEIPENMKKLTSLPGVGRKTANVVLSAAFGWQTIVVDTHVARLSRRIGMTDKKDPANIEISLMDIIPKDQWSSLCLRLIYHGRAVCTAKNPACGNCALAAECLYPKQ